MSYFPCDIPFMSDEELKENGKKKKKNTITKRDMLSKMDNQELAEYLCVAFVRDCSECIGITMCVPDGGKANGLRKWLNAEAEEDND